MIRPFIEAFDYRVIVTREAGCDLTSQGEQTAHTRPKSRVSGESRRVTKRRVILQVAQAAQYLTYIDRVEEERDWLTPPPQLGEKAITFRFGGSGAHPHHERLIIKSLFYELYYSQGIF